MTKHAITIEVDDSNLSRYSDQYLALCWHVAQANPAPYGDYAAAELVERLAREIVRRWLRGVEPALWHHQGRDVYHRELTRFARYNPPEGWQRLPAGSDKAVQTFHSGHWSLKPEAAASLLPGAEAVVKAATAWANAKRPGSDFMAGVRAEKDLVAAVEAAQAGPSDPPADDAEDGTDGPEATS